MQEHLLSQLNLAPKELIMLPGKERGRLLNFLIRWEAYQETLDCLDSLDEDHLVSRQDLRARALDGVKRAAEAVSLMQERVSQRYTHTANTALGRYHLSNAAPQAALAIAQTITEAADAPATAWSYLGDVQLQRGDLDAAEAAFLRHQQLSPNSRYPLLGLAQLHERRGDPVTAAAYAIRAYTVEEGQNELPIYMLRELRDYFSRTGDQNRLTAANEQLEARFQVELAEMRAMVGTGRDEGTGAGRHREESQPHGSVFPRPPLPDLTQVPVSEAERAELEAAARRYFNFDSLLEAQTEIMACARRGENVLAILPTGAGKSLCYQLPAFLDGGLSLVISPLIALMKDQVDSLPTAVRQRALAINSSLDGRELLQAVEDIRRGRYNLVYAAPERLRQLPFLHALNEAGLTRLVIDEAHCISAWGHDFRPDYLTIAEIHQKLGAPPILAMTATAPPRVREDIERRLFGDKQSTNGPPQMRLIATDTYRANLHLTVIQARDEDEKLGRLLTLCRELEGSGIIYGRTRRRCEELAQLLRQQGIDAEHYHAGLIDRSVAQDRFMSGRSRIIVATIAFGMGVDKADIRFIVHYGLPDSVEAYYQEAGRAGRDGQPAHCILMYTNSDKGLLTRYAKQDAVGVDFLRQVYSVVRARLNHFGHVNGAAGTMALDDLVRELRSDDTTLRVALSTLEQAGLLQRFFDAPRTVSLQRLTEGQDGPFDHFAECARLRAGQPVTRNFPDLAQSSEIPPQELEDQLLEWQSASHLRYEANGRDCLLALLPAPTDAPTRIDSLLSQYATIQKQRVIEIVDYGRNKRCRHAFLANYLGGKPRNKCAACDNCLDESLLPESEGQSENEAAQLQLILNALAETSWGRYNLVRILRGDQAVDERGRRSSAFGKLAFRSQSVVDRLIGRLIMAGHIQEKTLPHGGIALEITGSGRAALQDKRKLA